MAISSVWEMAALVEVLERKGLCSKQEVLDMIQALRREHATAVPIPSAFPFFVT